MGALYEFFLRVLNMSLTACVAILAILALRALLRKAPKQYSYLLWGIVLFRLLCPVSLPSAFSLLNLANMPIKGNGEIEYISAENAIARLPMASQPAAAIGRGKDGARQNNNLGIFRKASMTAAGFQVGDVFLLDPGLTSAELKALPSVGAEDAQTLISALGFARMGDASDAGQGENGGKGAAFVAAQDPDALAGAASNPLLSMACRIWLLGIAVMGIYSICSMLRLHRRVGCSMALRDNIYLADHIPSPFVLGFLRPRIYLPSSIQEREQGYIILHEQYHIKRRDYLAKVLAFLALCLHWFNPLAWLAFILAMKDMEMSCDEAVMRKMDGDIRAEYADSLLHLAVGKRGIAGAPLAFGEGNTESRIKHIMNYKKPAAVIGAAAALACLAGVVCLATNPTSEREAMEWAKHLSAGEIESIELVAMPQDPERQYKAFSADEFAGVASLIRQSRGKYLASHEDTEGGSIFFYITLADGAKHQVGNIGNAYLYIDGDYYDAGYKWLSSWGQDYGQGNASIPDGFFEDGGENGSTVAFEAKIIEIDDSRILVEPVEGSAELASADRISISNEHVEPSVELKVGDTIEIEYNGEIMESYPAQLGKVYRVGVKQSGSQTGQQGGSQAGGQGDAVAGKSQQADAASDSKRQVDAEAKGAIWDAIMEQNGNFYSDFDSDEYDFACCSYVNLETESSAPTAGGKDPTVTYYGWAYYAEYKFSETAIKEVGGSHIPVALTFSLNEEDGYILKEYWEPSDGSYFEPDIRRKFPPSAVEDALDSQKFVVQQIRNCYSQAIASEQLDTDPMVESLLEAICMVSDPSVSPGEGMDGAGMASGGFAPYFSSNPQEYIEAHMTEYRELGYFGDAALEYCLERFEQGGETGLEGHIMARICEELLGAKWEMPVEASEAPTGQEWYDALKAEVADFRERAIEPGEELALSIMKIGIPVTLTQTSLTQNRIWKQSGENQLKIQYDDSILGGQCTFWAVKDGEIGLPEIEYDASKEEKWEGVTSSGQLVNVRAQQATGHVLATWEYKDYKFAILGELPESPENQPDMVVVPKRALGIIMNLE